MDFPLLLIVVLVLLVVGLIVGTTFLLGWGRRSGAAAGARAGARFTATRVEGILADLGATLVIHAPPAVAADVVRAAVAESGKDFHLLPDGAVGIRFVEPDDTIARLRPESAGTVLRIETFRDYLGYPQTAPLWGILRALVTTEAAARLIEVSPGPVSVFERGPLLDDRNARWFRRA